MLKTRTLRTRFQFWVMAPPSSIKRLKANLDSKKVRYSYFCRLKKFSVHITMKDEVLAIIRQTAL